MKGVLYFVGGALVGFGTAYLALEDRFGEKYAEMANANQRAYEKAVGLNKESDTLTPEQDQVGGEPEEINPDGVTFGGRISYTPSSENPYHAAVEAVATDSDAFVKGAQGEYGISYIEEEEYHEEDGRTKLQIDILMNETNPVFMLDGVPIDDWATRIGDSILLDMFRHCPPGIPAILYVRNHATDEDYEVARVEP